MSERESDQAQQSDALEPRDSCAANGGYSSWTATMLLTTIFGHVLLFSTHLEPIDRKYRTRRTAAR
jgi:hypothetical protein